ncbi:MAG: phage terminase large subunit [Hyphomicrobiaceae bacterium]
MSATRQRFNRFPPKDTIEWLDHDQRRSHRATIAMLTDLALTLEKGGELTPQQEAFILNRTAGSIARDTRLNAAWDLQEKTEEAYLAKLALMAPHDLTAYHELINPHEPPAHHHRFVCEHLMRVERGDIRTLIIALPPGAAKSTYSSRTFAQWCLGRNPDWRVLAVGHSQKFVEDEFSKPNRTAIDSDAFRLAFPDVALNPAEKSASFWRLDGWRGSYACRGALAGTSGLRAKIVLADDLFKNAQDAMSSVVRENIWRWWTADVMSRRLPNAPTVLVNTLWHSEDVPGRMKRLYEDNPKSVPLPFEFINIPAQAGTDDPLGREEGEWLWCVDQQEDGFYTITDYLTKRSMTTPAMWSALYQGEPLDQQGEYIHEDQFQRYDRPPVNREGRKIEWTKTVMSVDCASKGKERSDYTAILIFRQGVDGLHYLVDVWRQKEPLETIVRTMSRMMRHWQVNYAIVEDSGMGAQILENYAGKMPSPMLPYVPAGKGSKDFRFDAAVPWITSGKILFPKNAPWLIEFINELVAFPNAANDDQADAFSQYTANELKFRKGGTRPLKVRI